MRADILPTRKLYGYIGIFVILAGMTTMLRITQIIFVSTVLMIEILVSVIYLPDLGETEIYIEPGPDRYIKGDRIYLNVKIKTGLFRGEVIIKSEKFEMRRNLSKNSVDDIKIEFQERYTGLYELKEMNIYFSTPGNMFRLVKNFNVRYTYRIFPEIEELRKRAIFTKNVKMTSGDVISKYFGHGTEMYEIREYRIGDEWRIIDWKKSAKYDDLYVRENLNEKTTRVLILVDAKKHGYQRERYFEIMEYYTRAVFTVALSLSMSMNEFGIISYSDRISWTPPGYGKTQLENVMNSFMSITKEMRSEMDYRYTLRLIKAVYRGKVHVIYITDLEKDEPTELYREIKYSGYDIMVLIPYMNTGNNYADRMMELRRKINILKSGIERVIEWNVETPLSELLNLKYL